MSASSAGGGRADRRAAHSAAAPSPLGVGTVTIAAMVAVVPVVVVVHLGAALVAGAGVSAASLLLAAGAALAVLTSVLVCGAGVAVAAAAAVLVVASPVAVAACAAPGTAAAALVGVPVLAGAAHRLTRRTVAAPAVLALGPLLGGGGGAGGEVGWGAGTASWRPATEAAEVAVSLEPVLPLLSLVAGVGLLAVGSSARRRWLGAAALVAPGLVLACGLPPASLTAVVVAGGTAVAVAAKDLLDATADAAVSASARRAAAASDPGPAPGPALGKAGAHRGSHVAQGPAPRTRGVQVLLGAGGVVVALLLLVPTWAPGAVRAAASAGPATARPATATATTAPADTAAPDVSPLEASVTSPAATSPAVTAAPPPATATPASRESLEQLLENPQVDFSPRARDTLLSYPVDLRLAALLVQLGAATPLSVAELPAPAGAVVGVEPLRAVVIDGLGGQPVGADPAALQLLSRQLSAQDPAYRAELTQGQMGTTTTLRLVLPPAGT